MAIAYNDPVNASPSGVGSQIRTDYFYKKALTEIAKEQYFGQMADVTAMPKNMGKTIKRFHYLPILDDRNINDQGINAAGVAGLATDAASEVTITVTNPDGEMFYAVGTADWTTDQSTTNAAALAAAQAEVLTILDEAGIAFNTDYATTTAGATGWTFVTGDYVNATGNLYGSSKDVGYIQGKIPALTEHGGRVNRVGMKRIELEGTIEKFGFFDEYTQESLDFDSDSELMMHITSESLKAANEMTEDQLQIDLLNGAGVIRYTGAAASVAQLSGEDGAADVVTYDDLVKLSIELDNNRCPKNTKLITGSRMIDTKVVNAARYMYIGSELVPSIMRMTDYHGNKAFIPVAQYGSAGTIARGEIGSVDNFRFIVVPEMMHWAGAGAAVSTNGGYRATTTDASTGAASYDVFPMLVVGDQSFTTIGFQTDGKTVKFSIKHKKPSETHDRNDPYGETGFYSIKWYYGTMILRPERLAVIKTVAEW